MDLVYFDELLHRQKRTIHTELLDVYFFFYLAMLLEFLSMFKKLFHFFKCTYNVKVVHESNF